MLANGLHDQHLLTTDLEGAVRVLFALTSFETFDSLARPDQALTDVSAAVTAIASTVWRSRARAEVTRP